MPLTQPKRDNQLMKSYLRLTGLSSKALAKRCGVSHSQMYMARERNVGPENAEKIAAGVAALLGLALTEKLKLKTEILGFPGSYLRAYLGDVSKASRLLDVHERVANEILDSEKSITYKSGIRALEKLKELRAPAAVIESVDRRLMPPPQRTRGLITYRESGPSVADRRRKTQDSLSKNKPVTHRAIQHSGLMLKELREQAGVGKETLRNALYKKSGRRSAVAIAEVLQETAGLSAEQAEAVRVELMTPPDPF